MPRWNNPRRPTVDNIRLDTWSSDSFLDSTNVLAVGRCSILHLRAPEYAKNGTVDLPMKADPDEKVKLPNTARTSEDEMSARQNQPGKCIGLLESMKLEKNNNVQRQPRELTDEYSTSRTR